jgi:THO complex subunit 3
LRWNCDGTKLAAGGDKSTLRLFDAERLLQRDQTHEADSTILTGHNGNIERIVASPMHSFLFATAGADRLVNLYDVRASSSPVRGCTTDHPNINMDWSPDGKCLVVGDREDVLYVIDADKMVIVRKMKQDIEINQMKWNRSGTMLFLACGDGGVELRAWPSMDTNHKLRGHRDRCYSIAYDPTGQRFAVTSNDTCVSVWSAMTFACQFVIDRAVTPVRLADYSHDGRLLAVAGVYPRIDITAAATGGLVRALPTTSSVVDLQWHPQRPLLAYCVEDDVRRPSSAQGRGYANNVVVPKTYVYGYPPPPAYNPAVRSGR